MLALASSGAAQGIRTNGSPTADMNGCDIMSNTAAQCNGSNLNARYGFAVGTSNCGNNPVSKQTAVLDPYADKYTVPLPVSGTGCNGNYPQETKHGNSYSVAASNQLSGTLSLSSANNGGNGNNFFKCGDQMLTADTVIDTGGGPAVLVIENGQLDLNGHALTTADGSAVTLVFSGDNSGSYSHAPTDNTNGTGGRLDINAPGPPPLTTPPTPPSPWQGVAI